MRFCQDCGQELADEADYCNNCGTSVTATKTTGEANKENNEQPVEDKNQSASQQSANSQNREPPSQGDNIPQQRGYRDATISSTPDGVKILSVAFGVLGVFSLIIGSFFGPTSTIATSAGAGNIGSVFQTLSTILILIGVGQFMIIYGLWNLKRWGWILAVGSIAVSLLLNLVLVSSAAGAALIVIIIHMTIGKYLYDRRSLYNV